MDQLFGIEPVGIKCDNPECDYIDMSVKFADYKQWINKPCPKCGANLLTEECYNKNVKAVEEASSLNNFLNMLLPESVKEELRKQAKVVGVAECDASGNITGIRDRFKVMPSQK